MLSEHSLSNRYEKDTHSIKNKNKQNSEYATPILNNRLRKLEHVMRRTDVQEKNQAMNTEEIFHIHM
jgi:hypothetical protein